MSLRDIEALVSSLAPAAPEGCAQVLDRYLDLLQQWNGTYNLTAVRDRAGMLHQHLADCLAAVPSLWRERPRARLLDVGSGGGLPGLVLAAANPAWDVTCLDTVAKKVAFVRQAAGALGLVNLRAVQARVEAVGDAGFDVVTSRAFASLDDFTRLTRHRLADGGVWMAMKGRVPQAEIQALPEDIDVFHVEHLQVPGLEAERCLVWMRRKPAARPAAGAAAA